MAYDPLLPTDHGDNSSAEMRAQLAGLKALIDAVPAGPAGADGRMERMGRMGLRGPMGRRGAPGEVTVSDLMAALTAERVNNARNPSSLSPLSIALSDPPTQGQVQAVVDYVNGMLAAIQRT